MKTVGSRAEVWHGTAKKTSGGLLKKDLKKNKRGRIVSKKMSNRAKKEKRLEKAGYKTKKGKFTLFKSKKKKGGGPVMSKSIRHTRGNNHVLESKVESKENNNLSPPTHFFNESNFFNEFNMINENNVKMNVIKKFNKYQELLNEYKELSKIKTNRKNSNNLKEIKDELSNLESKIKNILPKNERINRNKLKARLNKLKNNSNSNSSSNNTKTNYEKEINKAIKKLNKGIKNYISKVNTTIKIKNRPFR